MDEPIREGEQPVNEQIDDKKELDETMKEEQSVAEQNDNKKTTEPPKEEQSDAEQSNDNKMLDIVSDEYIAKRKKRRIITYSSISLVAVLLSLAIIILACININIKPNFLNDNQITYEVYLESRTPTFNLEQTNTKYKEFSKLMDDVFKVPLLTAMFTGRLGGYEINQEITGEDGKTLKFYSSTSTKTISSSLRDKLNTSYIRVKFAHPIKLTDKKGKEVKSKYISDYTLTFDELYFSIYNTNQEHEVSLYLATVYDTPTITEVKLKFNTYKLYEFAEQF